MITMTNGAVMMQIRERRKSRDRRLESSAIKYSEEQYRLLFERAQNGIMIIKGLTGEITDANPYLLNLLACSRTDIVGRIVWTLAAFRDSEEGREASKRLENRESIRYDNLPVCTKDGRRIYVELVSSVYEVHGDQIIQCNIRDITRRRLAEAEREKLIGELEAALANIKKLSGLIPICASCKNIRDDEGYWQRIEQYICEHSEANFTHGICPECMEKLYPKHYPLLMASGVKQEQRP